MKREHFPIISRFSPAFILSLFLLLAPFPSIIIGGSPIEEDEETYQETDVPEETRTGEEHQWSMYKHDLKHTGQNPNAVNENPMRLRWETKLYAAISRSSPTIDRYGKISIGTIQNHPDNTKKLYSIFPNGTIEWSFNLNQGTASSPAIDFEGNIYIGTLGNWGVYDARFYAIYPNGTLRWEYEM